MNKPADPRLVWLATVLAVAVCIVYVAPSRITPFPCGLTSPLCLVTLEQIMNIKRCGSAS